MSAVSAEIFTYDSQCQLYTVFSLSRTYWPIDCKIFQNLCFGDLLLLIVILYITFKEPFLSVTLKVKGDLKQ